MHWAELLHSRSLHFSCKDKAFSSYDSRTTSSLSKYTLSNTLDWKRMRQYTTLVEMFLWRYRHDSPVCNCRNIFIDNTCMSTFIDPCGHWEYARPLFAAATLASLCSTSQWITPYPSNNITFSRSNNPYINSINILIHIIRFLLVNITIKCEIT